MTPVRILVLNGSHRLSPRVEHEIATLGAENYLIHIIYWARATRSQLGTLPSGVSQETIQHPAPRGSLKLLLYLPGLYIRILFKIRDFNKYWQIG